MLNNYPRYKVKNVYTELSKEERSGYLKLLDIANEKKIEFGEPYISKKVFHLAGGYYRKTFNIKLKKPFLRSIRYVLTLKYKDDIYLEKEFKLDDKEEIINSIKGFLNNTEYQSVPDKSDFIEGIKEWKNLEEGWNGYACNAMSSVAVDNALIYYEKLCEYFPYYDIHIHPSGDSGHVYKQPEDSNSSVYIELGNEKNLYDIKKIEIEFFRDVIYMWGHTEVWNGEKDEYDYIYNFPTEQNGDLIELKSFGEVFEHLYWMDPELKAEFREKYINEII